MALAKIEQMKDCKRGRSLDVNGEVEAGVLQNINRKTQGPNQNIQRASR